MKNTYTYSLIIILFIINIQSKAQETFKFGELKSNIEKDHKLVELTIDGLNNNIKKFYGEKYLQSLKFYILDDLQKETICDLKFYELLGFYNDSLFAIIKSTDELPSDYKLKNENCLQSKFFGTDSIQSISMVRKTSINTGGNIFGEAGMILKNKYTNKYVAELVSTGMSFSAPSHKQYAFIITSRKIVDDLFNKISKKIITTDKITPLDIFIFSLN